MKLHLNLDTKPLPSLSLVETRAEDFLHLLGRRVIFLSCGFYTIKKILEDVKVVGPNKNGWRR